MRIVNVRVIFSWQRATVKYPWKVYSILITLLWNCNLCIQSFAPKYKHIRKQILTDWFWSSKASDFFLKKFISFSFRLEVTLIWVALKTLFSIARFKGALGTHPLGPISFNFMYFSEKLCQIIGWCSPSGWPRLVNPGSATICRNISIVTSLRWVWRLVAMTSRRR